MKNINKEDPRNKKFWCEEFMIHTTFNKCLKNCKKMIMKIVPIQNLQKICKLKKK